VQLENREFVGENTQELRCVKKSVLAHEEAHLQEALITGIF